MKFFRRWKSKSKKGDKASNNMIAWIGALAHEIKNPLNTMRLNLQLLEEDLKKQEKIDKAKALKKVSTLSREVDRQEKALNEFLRLARLPTPDFHSTDLIELLNELLEFIGPETKQHNIEIVKDFQKDIPRIELDSSQIRQSLLNVILNANQAMPEGGILTVKIYSSGNYVVIEISDTGQGIPEDRIDKIFDLFYSTKKTGTGLGLSIVKRIVNLHNGDINVESQPGEGTTFFINLPIYQTNNPQN
ncbi:GHKL domain-containing protein [Candidatus Poribacteria bacterium]|nr:GHKL domain-containing protein [Candidatus Poribacteria bacterium]